MTDAQKSKLITWLKAAIIRAVKTAAQVGVLMLGSDTFNIMAVDWLTILGFMAGGFVLSMLTSLAGIPEANGGANVFESE